MRMLFTTDLLVEIFPDFRGSVNDGISIKQVSTDSRKSLDHGLFIPLRGEKFDGHDFLDQAIKHGAVACLWNKDVPLPKFTPNDFPVYYVEDTLVSLQELARVYRNLVNPTVVGITGSNGKTTTKDIVTAVLEKKYQTHYTLGNLNNHIGVPLTILSMSPNTEVLVLEMGMNHLGEISVLSNIAKPDFAIITNIGESHIEHLGSREGIAQAKTEILEGLQENGLFIFDGDEPLLEPYQEKVRSLSVGFERNNDFVIENVELSGAFTTFSLQGIDQFFRLPLLGNHHAKNAAYAIVLANKLGMSNFEIAEALQKLKMTKMRFELINGKNGVTVINDAYNASPTSMQASIEVVSQMKGYQTKILILGDMFELGEHAREFHRLVGVSIREVDLVCTIGEHAKEISESTLVKAKHFQDKEALILYLSKYVKEKTLILVKASRGMKLETVVESLL